ncbi:MAG: hypothetical protein ACAI38_05775 [Myxococcota bacterium]|nr:hypothetical protein [Myxococcota bacterium]
MATAVLLFAVLATAPAERVLAVHTPSGDITPRQAGLFEAHLRIELSKHQGVEVVRHSGSETSPTDASCVEKPTCLAQLAKGVGADIVVFARTARLAGDSVVTMKRLRILTGEIEQTSTRSIQGGDGQQMLIAIGPMVTELFPERPIISGAMTGVTRDDVVRWTPPPVKPWMFWTALGATAASGGVAIFCVLKQSDAERQWNDTVNAGGPGGVPGDTLVDIGQTAERWKDRSNIAIGTTIGLGVTTAILAYFTDWNRERDTELLLGPTSAGFRTSF